MAKKEQNYKFRKEVEQYPSDRIPPQAQELEQAVLGAAMVDEVSTDYVVRELNPDSFYVPRHRMVFEAIQHLHSRSQAVDLLSVANQLKVEGTLDAAGGPAALGEMTSAVGFAAHLEYYASILKQKAIQRGLIKATFEIQRMAFDESVNVDDLMNDSQNMVYNIIQQNIRSEAVNVKNILNDTVELIQARQKGEGPKGVPTGYDSMDRISMGWQPGNLVVIGARPGVGKTAIALNLAANAAIRGDVPVAVFSLEMTRDEIVQRLLEAETGVCGDKVKGAQHMTSDDWQMLERGLVGLSKCNIYVDDTPAIPTSEFKAKASHLVHTKGVKIIFIDYLQIMRHPSAPTMREQVSEVSHMLKATAKELNVPIIALAQLNRQMTQRGGSMGRPILSDIKESGAIEQDADIVMFIHRPDQLGLSEDPTEKDYAEVIVAKNRNGSVFTIPMTYKDSIVKFVERDDNLVAYANSLKTDIRTESPFDHTDNFYNPFNDY